MKSKQSRKEKYPHYVVLPKFNAEYKILQQTKALNRWDVGAFGRTIRSSEPFSIQLTNGKILNSKREPIKSEPIQQQPLEL